MFLLRYIGLLMTSAAALQAQSFGRPTGFPVACTRAEVQVMLLGTYHFANPGRDVINQDIDDVLEPRRQAELEDLVTRLAAWKPDRIAVERPISQTDTVRARYSRYREKTLEPNRNEVVQIAFRLASRLGHDAVYPIDDDSFLDLNDSLKAVDQRRPEFKKSRDSVVAVLQNEIKATNVWMRTTTIGEHLLRLNSDDALHRGNMAHNLTRTLRPDVHRILVVVGSGHVPPLRNLLDEAPQFCPVSPLSLLHQ